MYDDGVPGDLTTAHPSILSDGTFVNFSRTLPFGGFHIYKQDPLTLKRTEVGGHGRCCHLTGWTRHSLDTTAGVCLLIWSHMQTACYALQCCTHQTCACCCLRRQVWCLALTCISLDSCSHTQIASACLRDFQVAFVPDRRPLSPAWLHDFAATDKYAVIIEHPLYMSLASLLLGTAASHLFMNWLPEDGVKVHVVALDGSKVRA